MNPDFFKGTRLEKEAEKVLAQLHEKRFATAKRAAKSASLALSAHFSCRIAIFRLGGPESTVRNTTKARSAAATASVRRGVLLGRAWRQTRKRRVQLVACRFFLPRNS